MASCSFPIGTDSVLLCPSCSAHLPPLSTRFIVQRARQLQQSFVRPSSSQNDPTLDDIATALAAAQAADTRTLAGSKRKLGPAKSDSQELESASDAAMASPGSDELTTLETIDSSDLHPTKIHRTSSSSAAAAAFGSLLHREPGPCAEADSAPLEVLDIAPSDASVESDSAESSDLKSQVGAIMRTPTQSSSSSSSQAQNEPSELAAVVNGALILSDETFQAVACPFLVWLTEPPVTQAELLIKARRPTVASKLLPVKLSLRFIMTLLLQRQMLSPTAITLNAFKQILVCKELFAALVERKVGSGRVHGIFLLVKKILIYLSSKESLRCRLYTPPTTIASFVYVDSICSSSGAARKRDASNRMLLGIQRRPYEHQEVDPMTQLGFATSVLGGSVAHRDAEETMELPVTFARSPANSSPAAAATAAGSSSERAPPVRNNDVASKEELQVLASGCLAYLKKQGASSRPMENSKQAQLYASYLVTATLCLGLAPRSQVLKQIRLDDGSFMKQNGRYWIKLMATQSKDGKPTMLPIPATLTDAYDFYITVIHPLLVQHAKGRSATEVTVAAAAAAAASSSAAAVDGSMIPHSLGPGQGVAATQFVFVKRNGIGPRSEFSSFTCAITKLLIGKALTPHSFRAAVITTFYDNGATQSEMDSLARLMSHDSATAKTF